MNPSSTPDPAEVAGVIAFDDERLVAAALRGLRRTNRRRQQQPLWIAVMERFALGSTYSHALCVRFGFDPDERVNVR